MPLYHHQPRWAEADPNVWWQSVSRLIPGVLGDAGVVADQVDAIGLCGLMHALVPVNAAGEPLANSMLWMDQRCQPECELIAATHGDRVRELTGGLPRTTTSAAKLYWLKRHHPDIVDATHQFLLPKDFIRLKLTGAWATDPSDAGGTSLLGREPDAGWSEPYLSEILDVSPSKFPQIRPSTQIAGFTTHRTIAWGLRAGIPVVTGSSDVRATILGTNLYIPGRLCLYMGTAAWLATGLSGSGEQMHTRFLGATSTFGSAMRWYVENLCEQEADATNYEMAENQASQVAPGADGLVFLPHLMGERGPYMSPGATGVFFGLTLSHRRSHLFRSVLEGTACQIRHILEEREMLDATDLWCVGGGTRCQLWLRIIADVTSMPVITPRIPEAGLLGSAMMAAVGIERFPDLRTVADVWVQPSSRLEPKREPMYEQLYARYRALDDAMQPFFQQ